MVGAVSFSLDRRLVEALQSSLPLQVLFETGTFEGESLAVLQDRFEVLYSVELSHQHYYAAVARFFRASNIHLYHGDSASILLQLSQKLTTGGVLYFLDAHWCVATNTAGQASQCPLLGELQAIGKLNDESVVLIDDARLFLSAPLAPHETSQWPTFQQIIEQLLAIGSSHELMVVNDVIAFFPRRARSAMESYAKNYGTDWLLASNCLKENGSFMRQLEEKEQVIHGKGRALFEKEAVIKKLSQELHTYQSIFSLPLIGLLLRSLRRAAAVLRPRLGNLNQYPAKGRVICDEDLFVVRQLLVTPTISIVTPSFQQGAFIGRTIKSVLDQNYPKLQYFVQDGGSSDSTVAVLKRYEDKLSGWTSAKDSGQSQAINLGFANTDGEIMAWLNSDDLLLPGALHTVADYFNRHPDVDVVYGNRLLIDEDDRETGRWILPGHDSEVLSWADYIPQETLFWRRRIWEKAGARIDESFRFAMDWDLLVRFRDAGARFGHIPQFLGAFRIHERQKTSAAINELGNHEMNRIRARIMGRVPDRKEIRRAVLPYLAQHIAVDIVFRVKKRLARNA